MIRRLKTQLRLDLRLLLRLRLLVLAPLLGVLVALLLRGFLPLEQRALALPLGLASILGALGFFISAGLVWLEQADGALASLRLTPLRPSEYLLSKGLSQGALYLAFVLPAALLSLGPRSGVLALLPGLLAYTAFLTFLGQYLALSRPQLAQFFGPALFTLALLQLPLLGLLGRWGEGPWLWLPGFGPLGWMLGLWQPVTIGGALAWVVLAFWAARRALLRQNCWGRL
ncbi:MAG: hypothetical protein RRB13_09685 [bacterium]|nr:hypothetical protein [bacterium]